MNKVASSASWPELQDEIDALRTSLPSLRINYPDDGDFLVAFAGVADQIRWRARHDDDFVHHVGIALTDMLIDAGLVPEEHRQH